MEGRKRGLGMPLGIDQIFLISVCLVITVLLVIEAPVVTTIGALGIALVAPVALALGVRRHRPHHSRVWRALGTGLVLLFASDVVATLPGGPLAHLLALAGYASVAVGGVLLLRSRDPGRDRDALLDALILAICAGVLIWHFIVSPELRSGADGLLSTTAVLLYPLADVALLALILRLVLAPGCRVRSFWYLCAALAVAMGSNLVAAAGSALADEAGVIVLLARCLSAAAALHPSMRVLTEPVPRAPRAPHLARLLVLAACLAVVPTLLGFHELWGGAANRSLLMTAGLVLTILVLVRLGLVMAERDAAYRQLEHVALHDPLTGLPNRRLLLDRLAMALARNERISSGVTVLFCDIDRFKVVNDSLGHEVGDQLLGAVAQRLAAAVRPQDTVARLGGDEFVVVCEGLDTREAQTMVARRIAGALTPPLELAGQDVFVTVSIGVASAGPTEADAERLLARADTAMYAAKAAGRDRYELSDPELWMRTAQRLGRENALRRAIETGQLRLEYQPIRDLRSGATASLEALVRWQHPQRGLLQPRDFIALAEETGMVVPLGAWVLEEACLQLREWQQSGRNLGSGVSVNISSRQLADASFVDTVERVLRDTGLDPGLLCLEITESVLVGESEVELDALQRVAALGVHVAVDDFGTGYASLAYLKRLPVDTIKIDRAFVVGLGSDAHDTAIVGAVVGLAQKLGLRVVAEGVETSEQLASLEELGCDYAQGFYLGAAAPPPVSVRHVRSGTATATAQRPVISLG